MMLLYLYSNLGACLVLITSILPELTENEKSPDRMFRKATVAHKFHFLKFHFLKFYET